MAASPEQEFARFLANKDLPKLGQELAWCQNCYQQQMAVQQTKWELAVHHLLVQFGDHLPFLKSCIDWNKIKQHIKQVQ